MPPLSEWTLWITGFVSKAPALDRVMYFLANDFFVPVSICLIILALWLGHPDRFKRERLQRFVGSTAVAIGISSFVIYVINNLWDPWPHPYELLDSANKAMLTIHYPSMDPSFPSNATTISFAAATGVWLGNRKAGIVLYILATLWTFAHFYAGVHFFIDILGGIAIGVLTALIVSKLFMPRMEPLSSWLLKAARYFYMA